MWKQPVSINRKMDKEDVLCIHIYGILLRQKRKRNFVVCDYMKDLEFIMLREINQTEKDSV